MNTFQSNVHEFVENTYANDDAAAIKEDAFSSENTNADAEHGEEEQASPANADEADPRKSPQEILWTAEKHFSPDIKGTWNVKELVFR